MSTRTENTDVCLCRTGDAHLAYSLMRRASNLLAMADAVLTLAPLDAPAYLPTGGDDCRAGGITCRERLL